MDKSRYTTQNSQGYRYGLRWSLIRHGGKICWGWKIMHVMCDDGSPAGTFPQPHFPSCYSLWHFAHVCVQCLLRFRLSSQVLTLKEFLPWAVCLSACLPVKPVTTKQRPVAYKSLPTRSTSKPYPSTPYLFTCFTTGIVGIPNHTLIRDHFCSHVKSLYHSNYEGLLVVLFPSGVARLTT